MLKRFPSVKVTVSCLLLAGSMPLCPGQTALPSTDQVRLANGLYERGLYELALEEYQRILSSDPLPDDGDMLIYRAAESARALGKNREALRLYLRVVGLNREGGNLDRARLRLADLLYREHQYAPALAHITSLLDSKPDKALAAPAGYLQGQILEGLKKPEEAEKAYRRVMKDHASDPMSAYAGLQLAQMLSNAEEKEAVFRKVLESATTPDMEVDALWGLATLKRNQGDTAGAADGMWQLWNKHPDSARVRGGMLHIGWTQLQAGNWERALEVAGEVPEKAKKTHADTWNYLEALSLGKQGKSKEAVASYQQLLKLYPESRFRATASYELAAQFAKLGEHEEVLRLQEEVLAFGEQEAEAWWLLAESARAADRLELAQSYYDRIAALPASRTTRKADAAYLRAYVRDLGKVEGTPEAYHQFALSFPKDERAVTALQRAGVLWLAAGKTDRTYDAWDRAVKGYPHHKHYGNVLFQLAMMDLRDNREDAGVKKLEIILGREQDTSLHAESAYWAGVTLDKNGKPAEAAEKLRMAIQQELKPEFRNRARLRLGYILQRREQPGEALTVLAPLLTEAPKELPDSLLLWMFRTSENGVGDLPKPGMARVMIEEARGNILRELGYYALATEQLGKGKNEEAVKLWKQGVAFNSRSMEAVQAWFAMGSTLMEMEKFNEAGEAFAQSSTQASALESGEWHAKSMMALGDVEMKQKRPAEAARLYMGLAVLYEDPVLSPDALWKAAHAFSKAGQPARAETARKELNRTYPDYKLPKGPEN